jgi:hypothetical protein
MAHLITHFGTEFPIDPLPHQRIAVYDFTKQTQLRFYWR